MDLKTKMLKESLEYKGSKFETNYYYSNLIKSYGQAIRESGLLEAYVAFYNKQNYKVMDILNKNINEVLYLSELKSSLLLEGYAKKDDTASFELNEGIKDIMSNFVFRLVGQKKLMIAVKQNLNKLKINDFEQTIPIIRELAKKGKVPLEVMKKQVALGNQVADGKLDPAAAFKRTQDAVNASGVIKAKPEQSKTLKVEEFLKEFETLINEEDFQSMFGSNADREVKKEPSLASQHGGYQYADQEQRKQTPINLSGAGSAAAAMAVNKTISNFIIGIPVIGPLLAPFSMFIVGMIAPIVLGLIFRKKK